MTIVTCPSNNLGGLSRSSTIWSRRVTANKISGDYYEVFGRNGHLYNRPCNRHPRTWIAVSSRSYWPSVYCNSKSNHASISLIWMCEALKRRAYEAIGIEGVIIWLVIFVISTCEQDYAY